VIYQAKFSLSTVVINLYFHEQSILTAVRNYLCVWTFR